MQQGHSRSEVTSLTTEPSFELETILLEFAPQLAQRTLIWLVSNFIAKKLFYCRKV